MGTGEDDERRCPACGDRVSVMPIAGAPGIALTRCVTCRTRQWSIDGQEATITDVLAVLHGRPFRRSISPLTAQVRSTRPSPGGEPAHGAKILPLRRRPSPRA